jgi:hypothetical protein
MDMNPTATKVQIDLPRLQDVLRRRALRRGATPRKDISVNRVFNGLEARLRLLAVARLAAPVEAVPPMLSLPVFLRAPSCWVARWVRRAGHFLVRRQADYNRTLAAACLFLAGALEAAEETLRRQEEDVRCLRARLAGFPVGRRAEVT